MPGDGSLEARIRARLADLRAQGLIRSLEPPGGIDLCSNDYLNLSRHPELVARLTDAIAREGCGSTGSRLLRGDRNCFTAVESRFAAFKQTERSLYFGSGYLANVAVMTTLADEGDVIFSDERNHASLIDGMRLSRARTVIVPHSQPAALRDALHGTPVSGVRFIVTESLFSMDGDIAPLADYAAIARDAGATLIVDEAHAVGIYGARGSGVLEEAGLEREGCLSINTGGKALGVGGAFVAGPAWTIEYLIQRARPFVFSTAPLPAMAAALEAALSIVEAEPDRRLRLKSRAAYLRRQLARAGIEVPAGTSQILPVIIGDNQAAVRVAALMRHEGFDVRAIRPPSVPAGTSRLRISVNAALDEPTLDRFVLTLTMALKEIGLCAASS